MTDTKEKIHPLLFIGLVLIILIGKVVEANYIGQQADTVSELHLIDEALSGESFASVN